LVHLFHIIIVGSLFLYVGINREKISKPLFTIMLGLGIIIIFYHIYKAHKYLKEGHGIWVNLIHILLVAPLLMVIGWYGKQTSRRFFEMLLMFGFAALGYHGLTVVKTLTNLAE
jgi:hypothetical protein